MREVILLQDKACSYTAALTQQKLQQLGCKRMSSLPITQTLLPCNFDVFGLFKNDMGDQKFNDDAEVGGYLYVRDSHQTR